MRTILALSPAVVLLASAGTLLAQPDPAAKAALERMGEAVKNAKSISYSVSTKGEGVFFSRLPTLAGEVILQRRADDATLFNSRVSGKRNEVEGLKAVKFLVVGDGKSKTWVDDSVKMVVHRLNEVSRGEQPDTAAMLWVRHLVDPVALAKELEAATIKLEAPVQLDGVTCDVVLVDPGEGLPKSRWSIAQTDRLPRKYESLLRGGGMNDAQTWIVTNLVVDGPVPPGSFAISTPEGYVVSDAVTNPNQPPPSRERAVGVNPDDLAPDFELANPKGEKVKLSSMLGSVVVLDFWGTWCIPCRKASPLVQALHNDYKDKGVKVFGLAVRETSDQKPVDYMANGNYTYGLLLKADEVAKQYKIKSYPTYIVIGKEGQIGLVATSYDEAGFARIRQAVDALLEGKPVPPGEGGKPNAPSRDTPLLPGGDADGGGEPKK
ncbi:MAG: redoxin domain-containing protein [Phycisphaerales bacterium]